MVAAQQITIIRSQLESVAEEMGRILARCSFSPNIRERLDFSCALFDENGELLAQAAHIPVHLGSMPDLVKEVARLEHSPGDIVAVNDPFSGGTHLPDITLVAPVFWQKKLVGFTAARAHHSDVGGMTPGSMGRSTEIYQEGLILPIVRLFRRGKRVEDVWSILLANVRTPEEREGDLLAQVAACRLGCSRLEELLQRYTGSHFRLCCQALLDYSERLTLAQLEKIPRQTALHTEYLEFEGRSYPIKLKLTLTRMRIVCDFTGSHPAIHAPLNATRPVTFAAVVYCMLCLWGAGEGESAIPINGGAFRRIKVITEPKTIVHAERPYPVVAGNVETSQRVVDCVLGALAKVSPGEIPASACGTMNNLAIGGRDLAGRPFTFYETMGGGYGGGPLGPGLSGVQVHMTNTRNTPAEALETSYPLRLWRYSLRPNSGGAGLHPGGDGLIKEIELLTGCHVSLLATRRRRAPHGLQGGKNGASGRDSVLTDRGWEHLGSAQREFPAGTRIRIESPGGGGWGAPSG